jgi:multiple sugar transport system permease protein
MAVRGSVSPPKGRRAREKEWVPALLLGGPAFLLLLVFLIGPFFAGMYFSFTDQRLVSPEPTQLVGLRNYSRLLRMNVLTLTPLIDEATGQPQRDENGDLVYPRARDFTRDEVNYPQYAGLTPWFNVDTAAKRYVILAGDPVFLRGLVNNLYFAAVVIPAQMGLGLLLALLVNQKLAGRNFFRTIYFSPVVTSMVVVSTIWVFLYDFNNGLINQFLANLGMGPVNWLGTPQTAMPAIIIMSVWQGVGMQMVLFLAGLQGIPDTLYEAASIDGANAWQKFWNVTLPGLRNTTIFITVSITIAAFQLFTQPFVMTNGGPDNATTTTVFRMIIKGFREQDIAYASAITVTFFLIILAINLIQRRVLRQEA